MDSEEIEQSRLDDIEALEESYVCSLKEIRNNFNTEIGRHEAMDRSFMINSNIEDFLINHPYIMFRPECYKLAFQAQELLAELYQIVGTSDFNQE
jgi:hypothetical protein